MHRKEQPSISSGYIMPKTVRFVGAFLMTLVLAAFVRFALWGGPALLYAWRRPSISAECAAVRPGMTVAQIEDRIHSKAWPTDESVTSDNFSFGNWEICQVQLDHDTQRAVRTEMVVGPGAMR
jgi:hypothetical protein